jgi:hypothetical protein
MRLSELRLEIEKRILNGQRVSEQTIRKLCPDMLEKCSSKKEKWMSVLYKKLYPGSGFCLCCNNPANIYNFRRGFDPCCSIACYVEFVKANGYYPKRPNDDLSEEITDIQKLKRVLIDKGSVSDIYVAFVSPKLYSEARKIASKHKSSWKDELYRLLNPGDGYCSCGQRLRMLRASQEKTSRKYCSPKCRSADPKVKEKERQTLLKNYGVTSPVQSQLIRQQMEETRLQKYGVRHNFSSTDPELNGRATNLRNHGVENPFQREDVKQKAKNTKLERYGVEHMMQSREHMENQQKSGFKRKTFVLDGKTFSVQGFEPYVIKYLANTLGVSVRNIKTTAAENVPRIPWVDTRGIPHIYHPDIYAKVNGKWWVIEVKSTYTAGIDTPKSGAFSIMKRKIKATISAGYNTKLVVVGPKKSIYVISKVEDMTRKDLKVKVYG